MAGSIKKQPADQNPRAVSDYKTPFIARLITGESSRRMPPRTIEIKPMVPKYIVSGILSNNPATWALIACAAAFVRNHILIVCAEKAAGASFVVTDKPTGDRHSSPSTTSRKLRTSQSGLTSASFPCIAGNTIMINDNPAKIIPIENLTGVDGWRLPSFIQSHANIGAKMTTNNGFNDWNHDD